MKKLVHGSTFSGIGAPEVAAEMLGWENAFHCEINPFGRAVLDYYFPDAKSYEDITKTDFSEWRGKIDVLTGGFPCQPFSYAGKRRGSEDDRYLWPFMLKCIEQVKPTWFIGENVAGIATMVFPGEDVEVATDGNLFEEGHIYRKEEEYVLNEICESLERAGYSVQPMLIPACAVGAPHRRDRVFIIAHRTAEDPLRCGCGDGESEGQPGIGGLRKSCAGSDERICGEEMAGTLADPYCAHDAAGGSCKHEGESGEERVQVWGDPAGYDRPDGESWQAGLLPENRWRAFPAVSPIYRGNDGFPFDVDNLTISFAEWKKESLKAYGNAIVPQVMYEIFRGIDQIENNKQ